MQFFYSDMMDKSKYLRQWACFAAFILGCAIWLELALKSTYEEIDKLNTQFSLLQEEYKALELEQQDLMMQVFSQSEPAWIEILLMRELGLVPEGQAKVYFTQTGPSQ